MSEENRDVKEQGVYGENHPKEEDATKDKGVREETAEKDQDKDTAQDLEETRQKMIQTGETRGGMGREGTPQTESNQGSWSRPEDS